MPGPPLLEGKAKTVISHMGPVPWPPDDRQEIGLASRVESWTADGGRARVSRKGIRGCGAKGHRPADGELFIILARAQEDYVAAVRAGTVNRVQDRPFGFPAGQAEVGVIAPGLTYRVNPLMAKARAPLATSVQPSSCCGVNRSPTWPVP